MNITGSNPVLPAKVLGVLDKVSSSAIPTVMYHNWPMDSPVTGEYGGSNPLVTAKFGRITKTVRCLPAKEKMREFDSPSVLQMYCADDRRLLRYWQGRKVRAP